MMIALAIVPEPEPEDTISRNTRKAEEALAALHQAGNHNERLAAAKALESAACQLRRALKKEAS